MIIVNVYFDGTDASVSQLKGHFDIFVRWEKKISSSATKKFQLPTFEWNEKKLEKYITRLQVTL